MLGFKKIRNFIDKIFKDSYMGGKGSLYSNTSGVNNSNSFTMAMAIAMYNTGIGRKIVNIKSSNIFKEGLSSDNSELGKKTLEIIEKKLMQELTRAVEGMLAFGRGCVIIIDGTDPTTQLKKNINLDTVRFKSFLGADISVQGMVYNDITHPNYNKPVIFNIAGQQIHHSRVIDFQYKQPTDQEKPLYQYGGISEFELIHKEIENEKIISDSLPLIIQKMSTFIYKIKDFNEAVQNGNGVNIFSAIDSIENKRKIDNALVIDSENDTKVETQTVAGLEAVANYTLRKIALVTSIPLAWLVGESVKGLNSTGDTEESIFWATIKNLGIEYVLPVLNEKLNYIGLESVWFNEQYQQTPQERATLHTTILNNAILLQQLGLDEISYMKEEGFEVEAKNNFGEFNEENEENEEDIGLFGGGNANGANNNNFNNIYNVWCFCEVGKMEIDLKDILQKNTKRKSYTLKAYKSTENFEIEAENFISFMLESISKRFKNQVLGQMQVKTVKKFTDEQSGNFAKIFAGLSIALKRKLLKQFSNKKIESYIKKLYSKIDGTNQSIFYKNIEKDIGINIKDIIKTDGLNSFVNANSLKTSLVIQDLRDKAIGDLSANALRLMTAGQSLDTLYKEVENITGKNAHKSKLVARQELSVFNAQLNKKRASNLGIKMRMWNAIGGKSGSKRTRPCHTARHGKEYPVDGKLYASCDGKSIEVGEEINCRCYDTFIVKLNEEDK